MPPAVSTIRSPCLRKAPHGQKGTVSKPVLAVLGQPLAVPAAGRPPPPPVHRAVDLEAVGVGAAAAPPLPHDQARCRSCARGVLVEGSITPGFVVRGVRFWASVRCVGAQAAKCVLAQLALRLQGRRGWLGDAAASAWVGLITSAVFLLAVAFFLSRRRQVSLGQRLVALRAETSLIQPSLSSSSKPSAIRPFAQRLAAFL